MSKEMKQYVVKWMTILVAILLPRVVAVMDTNFEWFMMQPVVEIVYLFVILLCGITAIFEAWDLPNEE